jgi:peptidoglycan/xylan/chitin deacetylase (PgdA/CDA1 family)
MNQGVPPDGRDFLGYGEVPPHAAWPNGARVAVSHVLNIEEGAELSLSAGDERNESIYEVQEELVGVRDLCMESHFEYGSRAGYWRIMRVLQKHGVVCTLNACARALERTPWLGRHAVDQGHEIMCHGWRWEHQHTLSEADERALIQSCVASIERTAGVRPVGVHHVAFRTPDEEQYHALADRLWEFGIQNSGEIDRYYFRSLYFREPNGILFEIATDGPGFTADEPLEHLGEKLALPPFLEGRRAEIEAGLKPL